MKNNVCIICGIAIPEGNRQSCSRSCASKMSRTEERRIEQASSLNKVCERKRKTGEQSEICKRSYKTRIKNGNRESSIRKQKNTARAAYDIRKRKELEIADHILQYITENQIVIEN